MNELEQSQLYGFDRIVDERDQELEKLASDLARDMARGRDRISQRMKNPNGSTTPVAVREAALKKRILKNYDRVSPLAHELAGLLLDIHLDENELALVMDARRGAAIEYWKRLADGRVYGGARGFFDALYNRGIDATALASLNQSETNAINSYIQDVLEKKWSSEE